MRHGKNVLHAYKPLLLSISGSYSANSANQRLIQYLKAQSGDQFLWRSPRIIELLPWFSTDLEAYGSYSVVNWYKQIEEADVVLFATPEYLFSLPGILKNALEWLVQTMLLDKKPVALLTAAAQGEKAQASLVKILKTMGAEIIPGGNLLIRGARGKILSNGRIPDQNTQREIIRFMENIREYVHKNVMI